MTEHFTQADMKELAGDLGISFYPRCFSDQNLTDLCNAAVNHKLQEWGAQEPVAFLCPQDDSLEHAGFLLPESEAKQVPLYARALPAQPVNAEIEHWKALYENSTAAHEETVGRAMKVEKELARIKAQAPVAYLVEASNGDGKAIRAKDISKESLNRLIAVTVTKLYAAPVAPAQPQIRVVGGNGNDTAPELLNALQELLVEVAPVRIEKPITEARLYELYPKGFVTWESSERRENKFTEQMEYVPVTRTDFNFLKFARVIEAEHGIAEAAPQQEQQGGEP